MQRRCLVAANWKMNLTVSQALPFAAQLVTLSGEPSVEVAVAPAFPALFPIGQVLCHSGIALAAQNCHAVSAGAYTGEVSAPMLADLGCSYVIIGHSERRQLFGETDALVCEKLKAVLAAGMAPLFCLGETLEEREGGKTLAVISRQLEAGLLGLTSEEGAKLVVAYEPVWAIGTGKTATTQEAQEVHAYIREWLGRRWGEVAKQLRILYGGSVKAGNALQLMSQPDIDGALVGGASLQFEEFSAIVAAARQATAHKK